MEIVGFLTFTSVLAIGVALLFAVALDYIETFQDEDID